MYLVVTSPPLGSQRVQWCVLYSFSPIGLHDQFNLDFSHPLKKNNIQFLIDEKNIYFQ